MKKKVVVGMSGGVDSSVAALLLKEQGYEVIGVTMQIWQEDSVQTREEQGGCCGLTAVEDARRAAETIGIPHYVMNFRKDFKERVIDYFVRAYLDGCTPNPCIACNRYVKWESLLRRSIQIGADYIATGHYARIERLLGGRYALKKSASDRKDQTYALYNLTQEQLKHTLTPVGAFDKARVRRIAEEAGLPVAHKAESMDICFVPDGKYGDFIVREYGAQIRPGNFVDTRGNVLGTHRGIIYYTIGQRKGLGVAVGYPLYVVRIRPESNEVVLGTDEDLFTTRVWANRLNFMSEESFDHEKKYLGKIRYSHAGDACRVYMTDRDTLECVFDRPQRAPAPGQALALYDGDYVAGGGVIVTNRNNM